MLNFCDFIQVYVFTTNHHLNVSTIGCLVRRLRETGRLAADRGLDVHV